MTTAQPTFAEQIEAASDAETLQVAVLIPCHNEAATIAKVVADFRSALPGALVVVGDNGSTDGTTAIASEAGALVVEEPLLGKGNAVRRLFADIEADVYLLVDGDDTYDPTAAPALVQRLVADNLDMVNGRRVIASAEDYRRGHRFGNSLLTEIVGRIFGSRFEDMLSGYRVFSRRFVKTFPARSSGFEIETELTVHALEMRMPVAELPTSYTDRPADSDSKLHTFRDGWRILRTIGALLREEHPLRFFGGVAVVMTLASMALAMPLLIEYAESGLLPRIPTAVLASTIMLGAFVSFAVGLILETVTRGRQELKRIHYLAFPCVRREMPSGHWGAPSADGKPLRLTPLHPAKTRR